MARTDRDSWDLASSVGATATMVAAARAAASRRPNPVINDPFAEPLVRAVGLNFFTKVASGELEFVDVDDGAGFPRMVDTFAARARFYDDYFADATAAGVRQVVIVASGLDARAYRLSWPAGTTIYEIDQPEVIDFKTTTLSGLGAAAGSRASPGRHRPSRGLAGGSAGCGLRRRPTDGVAGRGGADRIPAAGGRGAVARQHHCAQRRGQQIRRGLRIGARPDRQTTAASPDHDRPLARTRLGPAHSRPDLSRRAHRRRGLPPAARLGCRQIGTRRPVHLGGAGAVG